MAIPKQIRLACLWVVSCILLGAAWTVRATDPLENWTVQSGGVTNLLQNIAYGNGMYVAVGYGGSIITSPDGVAWTPQNSGTTQSLYTVTFGGDLFVAAGSLGTVVVSADGVFWTGINTGTRNPFFGSAYGNGTYLVVGGSNVLASANGLQWEPRNSAVLAKAYLNAVTFGGDRFVGVGAGGHAYWSNNTITWTASESSIGNLFSIQFGGGRFVAVGGGFGGFGEAAMSTDGGVTWADQPLLTFSSLVDVAYGNGRFVAIGLFLGFPPPAASEFLFESRDGLDWTIRFLPSPGGIYGLTYANSRFSGVGDAGLVLQSSSYIPPCLQLSGPPGTNGLEIKVSGEIGRQYRLQASPDAQGSSWQDLLIFTNPTEPDTIILDPQATRNTRRFYRAVTP